tara:strand:+ start:280 stop:525 length:246 start_codon:yes stop_codon:yes gene_type:complete
MPLLKSNLETAIKGAFKSGTAGGGEEDVAKALADAIHTYVSAADVTTPVTTVVSGVVAGGGGAPAVWVSGSGSGTCKGTLS